MSGAGGELRVLVVDDDFMVASIHTRFVEQVPGFVPVGVAATGTAALAEIERLAPDLVLLDVHLPDLSGIEVLRRLRGRGDDTGVIIVTAAREVDTVRAAAAAGAAHYLVKPFERDDLVARLEHFRRSHQALAAIGADGGETGPQPEARTTQHAIDAVFAPVGAGRRQLPKGLSAETAAAVTAELVADAELSAAEVADRVGISRVSARRYLEHFVDTGEATARLQYGGAGRPQRLYRRAAG
ncbi:response regulator [Nocardioides sp. CPCC 205120]|uniref:response regulator n=1 Tax=Nocardioides sp. CPCC 205120 TaxID=3406462 RepID=UPI003B500D02